MYNKLKNLVKVLQCDSLCFTREYFKSEIEIFYWPKGLFKQIFCFNEFSETIDMGATGHTFFTFGLQEQFQWPK